jgi:hypothetical protein
MVARRMLIAWILVVLGALAVGCTAADGTTTDGTATDGTASGGTATDGTDGSLTAPSSPSTLPHREPPIPGLDAASIIAAARAALPDATELTFPQGSNGYRPFTHTRIGYPDPKAGDVTSGSPSVRLSWEDDGTVIFVSCDDLVSAGAASPIIAICTNLPVTDVPAGALGSVWQSMSAGTWDESQPFSPVTVRSHTFDADRPQPGPAISFNISGVAPADPGAPSTSDL